MEANLTFNQYHVLESEYKLNPSFHNDEEVLSPVFSLEVKYENEKKENAILIIGVELGDKDLINHSVYVRAKVLGHFSLKSLEQLSDEHIRNFYKINALSILYPYLRSVISDLTSKGSGSPVILPPINIIEMVKEKGIINEEVLQSEPSLETH